MDHLIQLLLGPASSLILVLVILYGGWKKWWVFGWQYREKDAEKNEWKDAALRGTRVAERAVSLHAQQEPGGP